LLKNTQGVKHVKFSESNPGHGNRHIRYIPGCPSLLKIQHCLWGRRWRSQDIKCIVKNVRESFFGSTK